MMLKKIKVYMYTRVSTSMQVDGYSLDAQKEKIRKYADAFDYEIVGEYEDAGKSGKSIAGRAEFKKMLEDIETNKDGISFVLVFKLSRFGRNAADVLSSLQLMQDFGVNLICVEDGIDSSKDAGKLMISVLSAVAEIERENILVQTMEGRKQKAREGKWNGGFAPYGYKLVNGKLEIEEQEAEAVRIIFDKYAKTEMGANGIAKYLAQQGINKVARQNGSNTMFDAHLIRTILDNPVYCGKIAFGRRKKEKVVGTRDEYHLVWQDDYMLCDGIHEPIVDMGLWEIVQEKRKEMAKKYEHVNKGKDEKIHLLSGLLRCPICGAGMYGNKSIKNRNGKHYKDYYYYGCKHRRSTRGHSCTFNKQLQEEKLDNAVAEVISRLVSNPKFADMMQKKINMKVDTKEIDTEIANFQKQLGQYIGTKRSLEKQIDSLDVEDRHYERKLSDLQDRLDKMYDSIDDAEKGIAVCKDRRKAIEAEKLTGDNIYKVLIYFDKLYAVMEDADKRNLLTALIDEIQVYEEEQTNGQWLKSIAFKLPIIEGDMELSLDKDSHVETFHHSREYFFWISIGIPFYMFGQAMNPVIRADGSPKFAMASTLAGAVVNIILDPIFIFICRWGMMGAAVATVLGQIVTAVLAVWYLVHTKTVKISGKAQYAQIPMAIVGIVMKFFQIVISIVVGMAAGCIPIVGYNMGAGAVGRVKELFTRLLAAETAVGVLALLIAEFCPGGLIGIFGASNESVYYTEFGIRAFRVYLCMVVLACVNKAAFIFLQAMGKAAASTMLSMVREIVFGVGFALLLPIFYGLDGVLYSMPVSDVLTFIVSVIVIAATYKQLNARTVLKGKLQEG